MCVWPIRFPYDAPSDAGRHTRGGGEKAQQGELGADGLARTGRRAQQHIVVRLVQSRKALRQMRGGGDGMREGSDGADAEKRMSVKTGGW